MSKESTLNPTLIEVECDESTSGKSPPNVPNPKAMTACSGVTTSMESNVAETTAEAPAATVKCVLKFAILLIYFGQKFVGVT